MAIKIIRDFFRFEAAAGILLIIATLIALLFANTPLHTFYVNFFNNPIGLSVNGRLFSSSLTAIINDGLMTIFFLLVSLEIKRELVAGELNNSQKALLPGIAALGGMLCPILFFFLFNHAHREYYPGWAIPTATDIAFSLAVLSLLGSKIPVSLKSFLTALAILDDLGAIIIIAVFYTQHIAFEYLAGSVVILLALALANFYQCRYFSVYLLLGVFLWVCLHSAGIHATIAGVATGFAIPLKLNKIPHYSPLQTLEKILHPWVAYLIVPLFALANAGLRLMDLHISDLLNPLVLGIATGLFFGKQLGIVCTSWVAIKLKIAVLPAKSNWRQFYGVACLCGIGFTMSLFIGILAFGAASAEVMALIRLAVFSSSFLAGMLGYWLLK